MTVEVVSGIVVRDGRILLAQRPASKDFPFLWECSGGKVEGNESHHAALRRELAEELEIVVGPDLPATCVWTGRFTNMVQRADRADVQLYFYAIGKNFTGTPRNVDGQGLGWFTEGQFADLFIANMLAPGNTRAFREVSRCAFYGIPRAESWA